MSSGPITVGLAGILARMLRKRRVIFEARDVWPDTAIQLGFLTKKISCVAAHFFESLCYKSSHKIIALSPDMKDIISTRTQHISVISNACDLDVFSPNRKPTEKIRTFSAEKFIVIYSGTMGLANNVQEIVEIAGLMQKINRMVQFILLGDGKESEQIRQQITHRHIGNVHMLGNRPKYEVADWYSVSKISLCCFSDLPILSTNSPNKFFDSLAAGRPILNNTRGWIKKLLEDHDCGFSYEPGAYRQAVDLINYLVNHQQKLNEMSQNARVLAEKHFSRDLLANRYMEEFE